MGGSAPDMAFSPGTFFLHFNCCAFLIIGPEHAGPLSSKGKSGRLLSGGIRVRIPEGALTGPARSRRPCWFRRRDAFPVYAVVERSPVEAETQQAGLSGRAVADRWILRRLRTGEPLTGRSPIYARPPRGERIADPPIPALTVQPFPQAPECAPRSGTGCAGRSTVRATLFP